MNRNEIDRILDLLVMPSTTKEKPRQFTEEEVREQLFSALYYSVKYWSDSHKNMLKQTVEETLTGMVSSILIILDGESLGHPRFLLAPTCDETDKDYWEKEGKNWWAFNNREKLKCEITEESLQKGFADFLLKKKGNK